MSSQPTARKLMLRRRSLRLLKRDEPQLLHFTGHGKSEHMMATLKVVESLAVHEPRRMFFSRPRRPADAAQSRLIQSALKYVPADQRERYAEEWAADLADVEGRLAKWKWRLGIRLTAHSMKRSFAADPASGSG